MMIKIWLNIIQIDIRYIIFDGNKPKEKIISVISIPHFSLVKF